MTANFVSKLALVPFALLFAATCSPAQALKTAKPGPLVQCRADLKDYRESYEALIRLYDQSVARNKELEARNTELENKREEAKAVVTKYIESDKEMHVSYEKVIDKLISDLAGAMVVLNMQPTAQVQSATATKELIRQQKISNALAISNLFKVEPIQVQFYAIPIAPTPKINSPINCISSGTSSQSVYTTCQ